MKTIMNLKEVVEIKGDTVFARAYLVSEGGLWGAKVKIGIWEAAVLKLARKGIEFPIPLPYHVILSLMAMMSYEIRELVITEPLQAQTSDLFTAVLTIGFQNVPIESFVIRASDAIILSVLTKTYLKMNTDYCVRLPQDEKEIRKFIDVVKPEDFGKKD